MLIVVLKVMNQTHLQLSDNKIYQMDAESPEQANPALSNNQTYVLPCNFLGNTSSALSLTFGGVAFDVQYQDLM